MYAVFVIAAILLTAAPMHAHTLLAAVLPSSTPVRQVAAAEPAEPNKVAPAKRLAHRAVPVPPVFPAQPAASAPPASPAPIAPASAVAILAHAPNAP